MTDRTDTQTTTPAEPPQDHEGPKVTAVSHDEGLRVELGDHYLTAEQARRLAANLVEAADKIGG